MGQSSTSMCYTEHKQKNKEEAWERGLQSKNAEIMFYIRLVYRW